MTTPIGLLNCVRWAAAAFVSVVLALASQLALAHGGHHSGPAAAPPVVSTPPAGEQAVIFPAKAESGFTQAAWSQSCPDGSGGDCCCKHEPATPVSAKIALVHSAGPIHPAPSLSSRPAHRLTETAPQQSAVSRALPRAPPSFS
ncbi:MAG TPA: hypothetical protein VJQ51_05020 [Burkholderiales bacterium]|nr:hypothetical protein [Burkholderiales bacterium]